jgi:hypothetical protein
MDGTNGQAFGASAVVAGQMVSVCAMRFVTQSVQLAYFFVEEEPCGVVAAAADGSG